MPKEIVYSNEEAFLAATRQGNSTLANKEDIEDINKPLAETDVKSTTADLTPDEKGQYVAEMIQRYGAHGYVPTFDEAMAHRQWKSKQEVSAWDSITGAMAHTAGALGEGAWEVTKDVATLKVHKVIGSTVEGAALGTKNWLYMYEQGKYDEDSWLHKMLYDTHSSDEDYYWNLKQSLETMKMIDKDAKEGIIIPPKVNVGGMELDLTNPAVVQAVSFVADPSWLMPELGIEAALAKGLRGAGSILKLNEQLTNASVFASKKMASASGEVAERAGRLAGLVERTEDKLIESFKNLTGIDANIKAGGQAMYKDNLVRGAAEGIGASFIRIPAWGTTTLTWGVSKLTEVAAKTAQLGFELAAKESTIAGMRLSERIAAESKNEVVSNLANTWSKTASPMIEWATQTSKTSLHSAMYGGAFGLAFGGEEGFYNGLGTGFVLGGAFHQIGVLHNTIGGGEAVQNTVKNFLYATENLSYYDQEGLFKLLSIVEKEGGTKAKLSVMGQIAAAERLLPHERRLYYTEERLKQLATSPEFAEYSNLLANPDFGGVAFHHNLAGENVTIINVDRAAKSALSEELFHTLLLNKRYGEPFKKSAVESLIGTEDSNGALYKMPKEDAIRLLTAFKDSYLKLEAGTAGHMPEHLDVIHKEFNAVIEAFKNDKRPSTLRKPLEEFLAAYWNRFVDEKPIDYLLNGGDLGMVRNAIEYGKDVYRDIMYKDLTSSGANFKWGTNPDNFFIEQNTKQRIRVPMLDKLMRHYVKEVGENRYKGWKQNPKKHSDAGVAFASELEHLFQAGVGTAATILSDEQLQANHTKAIMGVVDEISKIDPSKRGLKFSFYDGGSSKPDFMFSRSKPKPKDVRPIHHGKPTDERTTAMPTRESDNKHWADIKKRMRKEIVESNIEAEDIQLLRKKKGEIQEVEVEDNVGYDKMEKDDEGFWKSNWQGNPRIKITGRASDSELAILAKYLPENTVRRFAQLNSVIERSKAGQLGNISNTLQSTILTRSKEKESGERKYGFFTRQSTFIPVELNLYFQRKKVGSPSEDGIQKYKMGDAQLLVKAIDMDAFMTRVDYAWHNLDEKGVNYKMVRRLFGTKENLVEAAKALLSNYSNGEKAEAGASFFKTNTTSSREAANMRDIVNAVIGYHPTKEMLKGGMRMIERSEGNYPLNMQKRQEGKKVSLPTVMTDFNITRIGKVRALDGEGFRIDHDNSYVRSQFNFSPSKGFRDHEGNFIPSSVIKELSSTVYRNKDGEILSVYDLRKASSEKVKISGKPSVYDFVDEGLGRMFDIAIPSLRGSDYTSQSGWVHYTPDGYEAGLVSNKRLTTGYIDTQRHLDISQIGHNSDYRTVIDTVVQRLAEVTGRSVDEIIPEFLRLSDPEGTSFSDLYNQQFPNILHAQGDNIDNWLLTKDTIGFFKDNNIHSVEYTALNELNGNPYSAVAVYDNSRYIENVGRFAQTEEFSFSPSKSVSERFERVIKERGMERAMLDYVLDKDGNPMVNTKKITFADIKKIIGEEQKRIQDTLERIKKSKLTKEEQHRQQIDLLLPYVKSRLRDKFKFAPNAILDQIAQVSLNGYQLNRSGNVILTDSVFLKEAARYGITTKAIAETGIPMLAHAFEMTEQEWNIVKTYPAYLEIMKKGKDAENQFRQTPEGKAFFETINSHLMIKFGGMSGFLTNIADRHQQMLMLMDSEIMSKKVVNGVERRVINDKRVRDLFAQKTRMFVQEILRQDNIPISQRQALQDLANVQRMQKASTSAGKINETFFDQESKAAYARMEELRLKVENIVTQEMKERIDDVLAAYNIQASDHSLIETVRTYLYDESAKGLIELGTPDAVRRGVELYGLLNQSNYNQLLTVNKSINANYIESLRSLESKGYFGANWYEAQHPFRTFGDAQTLVEGTHMWRFEGSGYTVFERFANEAEMKRNTKNSELKFLELRDSNGKVVMTNTFPKAFVDGNRFELQKARQMFLREATRRVDVNSQALALFSKYEVVDGSVKDFIIRELFREGHKDLVGDAPQDLSNWELRRNGNLYVALNRDRKTNTVNSVFQKNGTWAGVKPVEIKEINPLNGLLEPTGKFKHTASGVETTVEKEIQVIQSVLDKGVPLQKRVVKKTKVLDYVKGGFAKGKEVWKTVDVAGWEPTGEYRKLLPEEALQLREHLTTIQNNLHSDLGIAFQVDGQMNFHFPEEAANINTIEKRTKALTALEKQRTVDVNGNATAGNSVGFEKYIKELYVDFDKRLKLRQKEEQKRLDLILSNTNDGNISKIGDLLKQIRDSQFEYKEYIKKKLGVLNEEDKKNRVPPRGILEAQRAVEKELDAAGQASRYHRDKVVVLEKQLQELGVLDRWNAMSEGEKEAFRKEYDWLFHYGQGDSHRMAPVPNEGTLQFVSRVKQKIAESRQLQLEAQKKFEMIDNLVEGTSKNRQSLEYQIEFLARQYAAAKGHNLSNKQLERILKTQVVEGTVKGKKKLTRGAITETTFDVAFLKNLGNEGKLKPKYLADKDGILGKPSEFTEIADYQLAFEQGIKYIRDRWFTTGDRTDLKLQGILERGFEHLSAENTEVKFSDEIRKTLSESFGLDSLGKIKDKKFLTWMSDAKNREFLLNVETRFKENFYNETEASEAIREQYFKETEGTYGTVLRTASARLRDTNSSLAMSFLELDSLTGISRAFHGQFRLPDGKLDIPKTAQIETIEKSQRAEQLIKNIRTLEARRKALEQRIENVIAQAENDSANTTPEFREIVANRRAEETRRAAVDAYEKERAQEITQWRKQARIDAEKLFQQFNARAKQMGWRDSEVVIDPLNPHTQSIFFAFPSLSFDYFGPIHSFDWSVTTNTFGLHSGESAVGETFRRLRGQTEHSLDTAEKNNDKNRTVYLADYLYRAEQTLNYHKKNPSAEMTAEQALLLSWAYPDVGQDPVLQQKFNDIPKKKILREMELASGIRDQFKTDTERERFLRMYATEAFNLISSSQSIRIEAFKKLRGLTETEFESFKNSRSPEQLEAALRDKEVIENAMYLIKDRFDRPFISQQMESNPFNFKTGGMKGNAEIPLRKNGTPVKFLTGAGEHHGLPIDTLIRMEGFRKAWEFAMEDNGIKTSMFDGGGQASIKAAYEGMPLWDRMNLQTSTVNKLMLENRQGMAQYQKEAVAQRGGKPLWFADKLNEVEHGGDWSKNADYEAQRVDRMLRTTQAVEASVQDYKKKGVQAFITERGFALDHLLSLDDSLAFRDLDWSDTSKGSFRESNDGRYIIRKLTDTSFEVYFYGEKVKNASGATVLDIGTAQIATVSDLTQAQVLVRFFEDDVKALRVASSVITGGDNPNAPWMVGNQPMPAYPSGELLRSVKHAPQFSETVIALYEKNNGSQFYSQVMRDRLSQLSFQGENYPEVQYLQVAGNGAQPKEILITPSAEGELNNTHIRTTNANGHTVWIERPKAPEAKADPTVAPSEAAVPTDKNVATPLNPPHTAGNKAVVDASTWTVESSIPKKSGEMFSQWSTLRNRLNYVMVRLVEDNGVSVFRLFNPASGFMGQYKREQEAVDAILKQERANK